jgi:PD-(D/E)XK nuclease superfamily
MPSRGETTERRGLLHTVHGVEDTADTADTRPVPGLSPVQQRTLDVLRLSGEPIVFDTDFVAGIRTEMRVALDHFATRLEPDTELWISKHKISTVLDCEEHHLQPSEFEWTAANARGTVAHRAIELLLSWRGDPTPIDLVDEALARLADENRGIGQWLDTLTPGDEADVRGQTTVRVTQFLENFPPLSKRWAPITEASVRWPGSGPITLSGKVDLLFGRPQGRESRKVIIDLKTGRPHVRHRQDLGFYALLETLVREVPPRKVATFYLDAAEAHAEDVTERMLVTAMRRTLDGINAIIELESEDRPPIRRAGTGCRWCPIAAECDDGQAYLAAQANAG